MAKAKRDPAFLFYPGDASEDTQFMNRLERGAYFDILKAQKKLQRFSIEQIKKVLGADFAACWPAIELVLGKDEKGYYIEWLEESMENRRAHSKKQKERIEKYWREKREKEYQNDTTDIPRNNHGTSTEVPLENGIGNENEIGNENINKGGVGEKYVVPSMQKIFKAHITTYLPNTEKDFKPLLSIANFLCEQAQVRGGPENNQHQILEAWEPICAYIATDKFYSQKALSTISNCIQEIIQKAIHGDKSTATKQQGKSAISDSKLKDALSRRLRETG